MLGFVQSISELEVSADTERIDDIERVTGRKKITLNFLYLQKRNVVWENVVLNRHIR